MQSVSRRAGRVMELRRDPATGSSPLRTKGSRRHPPALSRELHHLCIPHTMMAFVLERLTIWWHKDANVSSP